MKISKNLGLFFVVDAIVLAVFNAFAWVLPFDRGGSFWTGYGFASFAILLVAAVGVYSVGRGDMKSRFYGLPMVYVIWPYLVIQVIIGFLEMALPSIPYRYAILLNVVLLAIVLIGLIGVEMGKGEVERLDAKVKDKVFYIRSLQGEVEALAATTKDAALAKELKSIAEALRFSDPMSPPQLAGLENQIEAKVAAIKAACATEVTMALSLCAELQQLIAERNRKCKLLK